MEHHLELPDDGNATGRDLGAAELELLAAAIRSGTLTATRGTMVRRLERAFAALVLGGEDRGFGVACTSGTAAIHAAVASLQLQPGDEVITTAITDMGAITPILYEGGVPVFCDVDPDTALVTVQAVAARLTPRTRAVIVTHLFGLPCDLGPILELAERHRIAVIEDCAQAPLARDRSGPVGTRGDLACYSFQQGKHLTTGEGGMVTTRSEDIARRVRKFVDKGWGYGEPEPDHDFPALNGRLTELQGAVGLAQLVKLPSVVARRRATASWLRRELDGLPGLRVCPLRSGVEHSYWRFALLVEPAIVPGGATAVARALAARGVRAAPHYVGRPAYRTRVFREWQRFAVTALPYREAGRTPEPPPGTMRGTERALERLLVLPWNEHYTTEHLQFLGTALRAALPGKAEVNADV